jgi:hypothetical protein
LPEEHGVAGPTRRFRYATKLSQAVGAAKIGGAAQKLQNVKRIKGEQKFERKET